MSLVPKYIKDLSPYVPGKSIQDLKANHNINKIVKLSSNENPNGPSPLAVSEVKKNLYETNRYPDSSGYALRNKLASINNLNIKNVILGCGSEGIMSTIIRTFLHEDDELIGSKDSFIGFKVLANASGRKINWVSKKNYFYDLESILKKINSNTKIIYLANPDNPTGTYFTKTDFDNFIVKVPKRVLVILDEAYYEYAQHIKYYPDSMFYRYDNVITLRTFSKCYGLAGFRIGYGFAHDNLISNLLKVKLPFEPSIPAQIAALAALNDKEYLDKTLQENKDGMNYLIAKIKKYKIELIPSAANFITIIFKNNILASKFLEDMLNNGIILRGLKSFGMPSGVRISIGSKSENEYFAEVLDNLNIDKYEL